MIKDILASIKETVSFIRSKTDMVPDAGIILGSGLGDFASEIDVQLEIPYPEIPNFPVSTVKGHSGKLIFGKLSGKNIVAMSGRFHYYEGYSPQEVVFPVRVMKYLGIQMLMLSNAAGSVNPNHKVGDLMVIKDHISLAIVNPLIGRNHDELGTRFPDMSEPYNKRLIQLLKEIAREENIPLHEGVYFGVTGPTFETRAEYNMIRILGADVVGMSTVQEAIVAAHMNIPTVGVSIVTDLGIRDENNIITHEEVLEAAKAAEPKLSLLFKKLLEKA